MSNLLLNIYTAFSIYPEYKGYFKQRFIIFSSESQFGIFQILS